MYQTFLLFFILCLHTPIKAHLTVPKQSTFPFQKLTPHPQKLIDPLLQNYRESMIVLPNEFGVLKNAGPNTCVAYEFDPRTGVLVSGYNFANHHKGAGVFTQYIESRHLFHFGSYLGHQHYTSTNLNLFSQNKELVQSYIQSLRHLGFPYENLCWVSLESFPLHEKFTLLVHFESNVCQVLKPFETHDLTELSNVLSRLLWTEQVKNHTSIFDNECL